MAFQKEDTFNKIASLISEKLSIPKENIKPHVTFKDLGADSLDLVELIMGLEELFGIMIKDEDTEKIKTIQDVTDIIHNLRTK